MGGIPTVSASSHAGEIQAAYRDCDTARFLKSLVAGLLFANGKVDAEAGVRRDKPIVVANSRTCTFD